MPRKGENIYKRKDGRWEGRYIRSYDSEHKAKYAYVYGKTYSEVKRKLTEQRGNVQKVQPTKNKSSTYGELLDCWLHSMQLNTKESTQARYTHLIKTHIKPHLGAVQLSQLTTDAIEIFIEQQLTDGRLDNSGGLSPKTVTDILTIIKSTIEYARYKELPVICNLSKLSIKKKEKEMRVFTPSEQESLIGTLTNDMDHSKFGVLLSLYTGIRVGELCALQWEDFDLAHSKLKIRKTMQRIQDLGNGSVSKTKIVITEPKSQCSIREIPLPLFIVDVAKKFASNPKAYILTGTDRYIEPRTMQNRFKSYVKECNVEPANFHVLRHTFATRCVVSKYKLLFFRFGPFNLVKTEKTKIKFTWLKTHGGQCVMYPSQTSTIKYKAYNLGGVIANAIIAALSTLLMLPNNFYLLMMMIELVFVGAYKILVNLIPHKTNGVPNDGYIVKMLDAHIAMRKDYALYLRIYADTFLNKAISPSDYQYERNESLSDDELLYYNEIQEILKSINAQMSKHEIDHCKGIVI